MIILARSDPRDVVKVIRLSRATHAKMVQNLAWATGYNVVAIPLAAGVLAPWGFILPPVLGAVVMSLSTGVNPCYLTTGQVNVHHPWSAPVS